MTPLLGLLEHPAGSLPTRSPEPGPYFHGLNGLHPTDATPFVDFISKNFFPAALESLIPYLTISNLPSLLVTGFTSLALYANGILAITSNKLSQRSLEI